MAEDWLTLILQSFFCMWALLWKKEIPHLTPDAEFYDEYYFF